MNYGHLTGLAIVALTPIVSFIAVSYRSEMKQDATYAFSPGMGCLMLWFGIVIFTVPLLPGASGDISKPTFLMMFAPCWGGAVAMAGYFFRYRVVIDQNSLTITSFRRRVIPFQSIVDWDVVGEPRAPELITYLSNGERIRFSGMLIGFADLVLMIDSHMPARSADRPASSMKLKDREARAASKRRAQILIYGGVVLIAFAALLRWWIG